MAENNFNFDPFPVLMSRKIRLRNLMEKDAENIFRIRSNDDVNKFLDRPKANSLQEARAFIVKIQNGIKLNQSIYWVITDTSDTFVGTICLWNIDREKNSCEIGYELFPDHQGKGIMHEAMKLVLEYGFGKMHLTMILAYTHRENKKSSRLLENFNFSLNESPSENLHELIYSLIREQAHAL